MVAWHSQFVQHADATGSAPGGILGCAARMGEDEALWVTVRRQRDVVPLEVKIWPSQTVADLKRAVSQVGGIPACNQRLFVRSRRLEDTQTLRDCGVVQWRDVQLVPALAQRAAPGVSSIEARRGYNMIPGAVAWKPARSARLTKDDVSQFHGLTGDGDEETLEVRPFTAPAPQHPTQQLPPLQVRTLPAPQRPSSSRWNRTA